MIANHINVRAILKNPNKIMISVSEMAAIAGVHTDTIYSWLMEWTPYSLRRIETS